MRRRVARARFAVAAAAVAGALSLWFVLASPPDEGLINRADGHAIPAIPMPSHDALLPPEARAVVHRAIEQCRAAPSAESFINLGRIYHGNGLTLLAAQCYEIALDLGAGGARTPYLLGLILLEEGRAEDAASRFREAIERGGAGYAMANHNLGRALLDIAPEAVDSPGLEEAIGAMARAVDLSPDDPVLRTGYAAALRRANRLDEAEAALRDALRLDADHAAAHQLLGLILHAGGESEKAAAHLARMRQYSSTVYNDPWAWEAYQHAAAVEIRLDWARNFLQFGRMESAMSLLGELAREHPDHPGVFRALAEARLSAGDHQRALNGYARAAELDPGDGRSRLAMAKLLFVYERYAEADELAQRAIEVDPTLIEALGVRGGVALRQGRAEEAIGLLEHVRERRPDDLRMRVLLGEALIDADRPNEAAEELRAAIALRKGPAVAFAKYQLSRALVRLGHEHEAKQALLMAAALEPENPQIERALAALRDSPQTRRERREE